MSVIYVFVLHRILYLYIHKTSSCYKNALDKSSITMDLGANVRCGVDLEKLWDLHKSGCHMLHLVLNVGLNGPIIDVWLRPSYN